MPSRRISLVDVLLWLVGIVAALALIVLFLSASKRQAPASTDQAIVLVTPTFTSAASATAENVWQIIVTPTPGGPLYLRPTVVYSTPLPVIYPPPRPRAAFDFGGQVLDFKAPDPMTYAGMKWVKFQIHEGDNDAADKIARGHGKGFKVLLGVVGDVNRVADSTYYPQFAAYVGSLAAGGADAIEIWNEPNIARDWPSGQISPTLYIDFLRPSYQAIKAANPNTLVITAGMAATLMAQNLRTPNFWAEVDYTTEFVLEGGLLYADCVGVHYNIGITAPDYSDAAPTGDAAFFYYPRILEHYANITKGTRPLCFTEFGYLTADGYPPLSQVAPNFGWAQNNTIQDQAQWFAQAVKLASANPQVEMFIIWNVDFWSYGADPHAGYAIIRKDGGCPACDALHGLGLGG